MICWWNVFAPDGRVSPEECRYVRDVPDTPLFGPGTTDTRVSLMRLHSYQSQKLVKFYVGISNVSTKEMLGNFSWLSRELIILFSFQERNVLGRPNEMKNVCMHA